MHSNIPKNDADIQRDVLAELKYEPTIKATDIGVLVKGGVVTLNGYVTSYREKWDAVRAAKRVAGVRAIADDIEIKLADSLRRTDGDIAADAADQLKWSTTIPAGDIDVTVRDGWITLENEVEWAYQKGDAGTAVQHLAGIKGITNLITIKPKVGAAAIETTIRDALERNALVDAKKVLVETSGDNVVLRGNVRNFAEKDEAERVAWAAPGVVSVENKLNVEWVYGLAE